MSKAIQEQTLPKDYNMKVGPVLLDFTGSIEGDYISNVALTNTNPVSDFTLTPEVGMAASWPVTATNTLSLSTSIGYTKYLIHPQYDTSHILVAPNSRLAFDIYVGNFKINLHDEFSYQQDPVSEAAFSNVVNFDRFENIAGVTLLWDMNKVILNLNYDHINFISTGIQTVSGSNLPNPEALNYTADQVSGAIESHLSSTLLGGLEAAGSIRTYDQYSGNYTSWSAGPFMKVQATEHVEVELSGGYQYIHSPSNLATSQVFPSNTLQPGTSGGTTNSYYANLTLDHQVNDFYLQRFSVGHDTNLGVLGDQSDTTYVNYSSSWHVNRRLNLALTLSYQDIGEVGGLVNVSSYNLFEGGLQANFPVTKSLSGSVLYQFTDKIASETDQGYIQNKLGFILTYQF